MLTFPLTCGYTLLNSCVRMMREAVSFDSRPLNWQPAHTGGIETNGFFVASRLLHERLWGNVWACWHKPDALNEPRRGSVMQATTENRQTVEISVWLTIRAPDSGIASSCG